MNKKGQRALRVATPIVVASLLILLIIVIFLVIGVFGPLFAFTYHDVRDLVVSYTSNGPDPLLNQTLTPAIQTTSDTLDTFEIVGYILMFLLFAAGIIFCYYSKAEPILIPIWIFMIGVFMGISIYMSQAYIELADADPLYGEWGSTDLVLRYFPYFILFIGLLMGFIMFLMRRFAEQGQEEFG